jgi:DNA anti-recombination protein RmuC
MEAMREAWTDERLDDLTTRVDEGFRELRKDLRSFRGEVRIDSSSIRSEMKADSNSLRAEMRADSNSLRAELKAEMEARFDKVDTRFDRLERRFERRFDAIFAALVTGFVGLIATHYVG